MKNGFLTLLTVAGLATAAAAQDTVSANIGITPGLSLHRARESIVNFNLTLINSRVHALEGVNLAGLVSRTSTRANGFQGSYLVASCRELNGFQVTGIYNGVAGNATGYQAVGLVNKVGGDLRGVQAAGLLNIVRGTTNGGQAGLINVAKDVNGFQLGFINVAKQMNGVPLGIINVAQNGSTSLLTYATNMSGINVGAKFIVNNFVSSLTIGGYDIEERLNDAVSFTWSWGYHIPLDPFYLEVDAVNMLFGETTTATRQDPRRREYSGLRLTAGVDIAKFLGIFGGVAAGVAFDDGNWENPSFKPMYHAGLTLF